MGLGGMVGAGFRALGGVVWAYLGLRARLWGWAFALWGGGRSGGWCRFGRARGGFWGGPILVKVWSMGRRGRRLGRAFSPWPDWMEPTALRSGLGQRGKAVGPTGLWRG